MLETGVRAPDFTWPNQDREDVALAALLSEGKAVVLFYPKADTRG